jgi:metal-sulfur cluster biosynthetic enzyme
MNLDQLEDKIIEKLKMIYDPEIAVNIYDLGLIYSLDIQHKGSFTMCIVTMTFTSANCPVSDSLYDAVKNISTQIEDVGDLEILPKIVFEPQWSKEMMNDEAKLALGML